MAESAAKKAKRNQWVKLEKAWKGHAEGEKVKVPILDAQTLIKELTAVECKSPSQKLIQKAAEVIGGKINDDVAKGVKEALDIIIKESQKAQEGGAKFPWQTANNNPGTSVQMYNDAGMVPQVLARGAKGELMLGQGRYNPFGGSGIGMGKFLVDIYKDRNSGGDDTISKAICKAWDVEDRSRLPEEGPAQKAALAESSGTTGGYTVPVEFMMRLMQLVIQQSVIRPRAQVFPMAARELRIPTLDVTTPQAAGVTAFLAGLQAQWAEEAASRPEFEPAFKDVALIAHMLTGFTLASNEILADNAVALDALLARLFTQAISWFSDYAFLQGNGAGKPVGILGAPVTISVTRTTSNKFLLADVANMYAKLLTTSMGSACWVMSQSVIPQLIQLADAANRVVWIPNIQSPSGGIAQTPPTTLLGLPIIFTEKLPPLGSSGDVMLIDASYYLIGDRMQIEIASSIHYAFRNYQTAWRFVSRVDGKPWLDSFITLADGSSTVSPFISLHS